MYVENANVVVDQCSVKQLNTLLKFSRIALLSNSQPFTRLGLTNEFFTS